jgi:HSP20 family protein
MMWSRARSSPFRSPFEWDPSYEIEQLRQALDRVVEQSVPAPSREPGRAYTPEVSVYNAGAAFVVCVDLPGVRASDVELLVEGSALQVSGRRDAGIPGNATCLFSERVAGAFTRTITLPQAVDPDRVVATLRCGVLEIVLPKGGASGLKRLAVRVEAHE